jgi:hypothetical protein
MAWLALGVSSLLTASAALGADPQPSDPASRRTRLVGRAYLDRNRDVVGATVVVRPVGDPSRIHLTTSDGSGAFSIADLPDGVYTVRIERPGLSTIVKEDVTVRSPFRAVVEVRMQRDPAGQGAAEPAAAVQDRPVRVTGRVVDRDGAPITETRISLVDRWRGAEPAMGETDAAGAFLFDGVPAGRWAIEIAGVAHLPIHTALDLSTDTALEVSLVRQPPDYRPSPQDLMPLERPVAPESLRF